MDVSEDNKKSLRAQYLAARRGLAQTRWTEASAAIYRHLVVNPVYRNSTTILTYVSARDNEVDTWRIIDHALACGKRVLVPMVAPGDGMMKWAHIDTRDTLVRGRFDLLEPDPALASIVVAPTRGLCITPGLAFTREGHRVGYGGGYYDRFLAGFTGLSIGLAFEIQLTDTLPVSPHDQPVDYVLTEQRWHLEPPSLRS